MVLNSYSTSDSANKDRTYDVMKEAEAFQDKTSLGLTVYGAKNGHVYGHEDDFPTRYTVLLHTLMSIAFQKTLVEKHYNNGKDPTDDLTESLIYTIGFGLDSYSESVQAICSELLDPAHTFGTEGDIPGEKSSAKTQRLKMNQDYADWYSGKTVDREFTSSATNSSLTDKVNPLHANNLHFPIAADDLKDTGVTKEDIEKNIRYNQKYFVASLIGDGSDNQSLQDVFEQILDMIQGVMFAPVAGTNDLGVDNSVTYMDPVGKYMDVKDVKSLVLFGKQYGITETAVYSYQWNNAYLDAHGGRGGKFTPGWYLGEPGTAQYSAATIPGGHATVEEAWAAGWVYRLDSTLATQFVPTLADIDDVSKADPKMQATEYTFYRIKEGESTRQELHMNPAYLKVGQTEEQALAGKEYKSDGSHRETPGVYALADLRIWVEDSGDYSDPATGGALTDTNFDEALWINIPVNMLPLRAITINEEVEGHFTYETNLDSSASFPLRVFYTVGVSDEVLENGRINIAGAIKPEYINQNKVTTAAAQSARGIPQGNLEFFSNWYNPLNRYGDYVTTSTDYTYGDPVTSFSPSADNRYYVFEKALPLYSAAYVYDGPNGWWRQVQIKEDPTTSELADPRTFDANDFGGKLIAQDLEVDGGVPTSAAEATSKINAKLGEKDIHYEDGDMVLLVNHRLTDVTKPTGGTDPFSSNSYFFLPIDFFELGVGGVATRTQYLITRKGSEFGSAYTSSKISNGDMLCWHDVTGKVTQDYPYLSQSVTGDNSRGRDYIGRDIHPDTGWYRGVEKGQAPSDGDKPKNGRMLTAAYGWSAPSPAACGWATWPRACRPRPETMKSLTISIPMSGTGSRATRLPNR